ncbi:MFS transporter, partial [Salmonella enterica]|nr:MFS transporter [Salmonella enterica]
FPAGMVSEFGKEEYVGYVFSLMSIGTVTGGMLYTRIVKKCTATLVMRAWMAYGLFFFLVALALKLNLFLMLVLVFCLGFAGSIVDISIITCIQTLSRGSVGKNYGIYSTVANACEALSGVVAGIFYLVIGSLSFPVMAILIGVSAKMSLSISVKKNESK